MVSEQRRQTYAAAVNGTGEAGRRSNLATPILQSPARQSPISNSQRNAPQRSSNAENIENPLHLNSNDNSNIVLVTPPLAGSTNYATWSISMRVALEVKNKWGFVDGSILEPDLSDEQHEAWKRCNLMICAWICRSVIPSIAQSVLYKRIAKDLWNDLKERFAQQDPHRISILQNEIYNLKQGNLPVNDYYTKCKALWEQMNELRPLPMCKCVPQCSCDLMEVIRSDREIDQIIRFLQGLSDEYNSLKQNVLVLDPLPDMHRVFVMAEKFERQLNITHMSSLEIGHTNALQANQNSTEEVVAAVNQFNNRRYMNNNAGNKSARCTFCGMSGHTVEKCYKKHGYPPGWVPGFKSKGKQQFMAASTSNDAQFSPDQIQKLISLLQNQAGQTQNSTTAAAVSLIPTFEENHKTEGKCTFNTNINSIILEPSMWILDSGATDHIACTLDSFDEYHAVEGAIVNLPNGNHIAVQHVGNIRLNNEIWLKNVLHIPTFQFNIVSVNKLLQDSSYTLIFASHQCLLRERHGRMTGFAKQEKGLYLLSEPPGSHRQSNTCFLMHCSLETWHQRLGHYPINKMQHLHDFPVSNVKTSACDVCHFSKHKRSPFPRSTTLSNVCFELIHVDIWGPFMVKSLGGERYFLTIVECGCFLCALLLYLSQERLQLTTKYYN